MNYSTWNRAVAFVLAVLLLLLPYACLNLRDNLFLFSALGLLSGSFGVLLVSFSSLLERVKEAVPVFLFLGVICFVFATCFLFDVPETLFPWLTEGRRYLSPLFLRLCLFLFGYFVSFCFPFVFGKENRLREFCVRSSPLHLCALALSCFACGFFFEGYWLVALLEPCENIVLGAFCSIVFAAAFYGISLFVFERAFSNAFCSENEGLLSVPLISFAMLLYSIGQLSWGGNQSHSW